MLISELWVDGFRFIEIEPYARHAEQHVRRFIVQQWCPIIERWCRVLLPGTWHQNFRSADESPVGDDACGIRPSLLKDIGDPPKAVVACREKHGTYYFSATSTEEIGMAALHVLRERHEQGYYSVGTAPIKPDRSIAEFADAPKFAALAKRAWRHYEQAMRQYREEKDFVETLDRTLAMDDYWLAAGLLVGRNAYEYEGFAVEPLAPAHMPESVGIQSHAEDLLS